MRIVVGFFEDPTQAQAAIQDLVNAGFQLEDLSLVVRDSRGVPEAAAGERASGAAVGAGAGAALGGLGGVLAGLTALAIPGIGPILAAGPIVAALAGAGIGAAAGGLIGALVDVGVPEEEARYYADAVGRGGALVVVRTEREATARAEAIIQRHRPRDLRERREHWRESA